MVRYKNDQFKTLITVSLVICATTIALGYEITTHSRRMAAIASTAPISSLQNASLHQPTIPELLVELNAQQNPKTNGYLNTARAEMIRSTLDGGDMNENDRVQMEYAYGKELLNAGNSEEALHAYQKVVDKFTSGDPEVWIRSGPPILIQEAVAYLRMGESQNCCSSNNARSCLLPISGAGVHTKQEGSRGAIKCLLQVLELQPQNISARWLLNIAYMTVGEYPKNVPTKWLIPLSKYGGEYPMKKFYNAAPDLGLDLTGWAGGVIMDDFEGNGLLDFIVSSYNINGQLRYIHNNGDGTFTDKTKESGLIGEVGGLNVITTDFNNDGRPDIIVLRGAWNGTGGHYPLSLLRNDGKGHFTDVTIQAGLLTTGPTQTAVAFDYNGDGLLDLFIGYETTQDDPNPCKLFRNNGNGTFTDVSKQCGLNITRFVKGVVSADYTHSGRPGLYLSCKDGKQRSAGCLSRCRRIV